MTRSEPNGLTDLFIIQYMYIYTAWACFIFRNFSFIFLSHQFEFPKFLDEIRNCFSKRNTKRKHYNNEATTKIVPRFLDNKQGEYCIFCEIQIYDYVLAIIQMGIY